MSRDLSGCSLQPVVRTSARSVNTSSAFTLNSTVGITYLNLLLILSTGNMKVQPREIPYGCRKPWVGSLFVPNKQTTWYFRCRTQRGELRTQGQVFSVKKKKPYKQKYLLIFFLKTGASEICFSKGLHEKFVYFNIKLHTIKIKQNIQRDLKRWTQFCTSIFS